METGFLEGTIAKTAMFRGTFDFDMNHATVLEEPRRALSSPLNNKASDCDDHHEHLLAIADAMDVLHGKWKIRLIGILLFKGKMRFGELLKHVKGIGAKMLSKELQNLESNKIITRKVLQTKPITVEYEITPYGRSLETIIMNIIDWGVHHRRKIMKG
jgi:DNA-binding HxlR family transcriptional regulator